MVSRADAAVPPPAPRTFDEAFAEFNLTPAERKALVWHLAAIRTQGLIEDLLPGPIGQSEYERSLLGALR